MLMMSSYLSKKEAGMRKLILSMKTLLSKPRIGENFVYMMFFATMFLLIYITTNIGG